MLAVQAGFEARPHRLRSPVVVTLFVMPAEMPVVKVQTVEEMVIERAKK